MLVGVAQRRTQPLDLALPELRRRQGLVGRLPEQTAGRVGDQMLLARSGCERCTFGAPLASLPAAGSHRLRTSSSVSSVTLSLRSSMARSTSRTAKQMFWKEML